MPNPDINVAIGPHFRGASSVVIGTITQQLGSVEPGMLKFLFPNFVQCSILTDQDKDGREKVELVGLSLLAYVQDCQRMPP